MQSSRPLANFEFLKKGRAYDLTARGRLGIFLDSGFILCGFVLYFCHHSLLLAVSKDLSFSLLPTRLQPLSNKSPAQTKTSRCSTGYRSNVLKRETNLFAIESI